MFRSLRARLGLGLLAALVFVTGVYLSKPLGCGDINRYGSYNDVYDAGIVYGGGPEKSLLRIDVASDLQRRGIFPFIILTGTMGEIETMESRALRNGILRESTKRASAYSTNTTQNVATGYATAVQLSGEIDPKIAHVSSRGQAARVEMVVEKLGLDKKKDDDSFPVEDGYGRLIFFKSPPMDSDLREYAVCVATRFGLVK